MLVSSGIRLLGFGGITDLDEAESLSYANDVIDIYSNSWGPCDSGCVGGPERLTQMALKNGAETVSKLVVALATEQHRHSKQVCVWGGEYIHASQETGRGKKGTL